MKKLIPYCLLPFMTIGLLSSCGDDDEKVKPEAKTTSASIDGSWHRTSSSIKTFDANNSQVGDTKEQSFQRGQAVEIFTPPSSYSVNNSGTTYTGTYQIKQDSLFTIINSISPAQNIKYKIDSLSASRLVLSTSFTNAIGGRDAYTFKYSR